MSVRKLLSAAGVSEDKLYVDDVFSTYLYTGNGSTQTINNGIDLAGEGGLVWVKDRGQSRDHSLYTFPNNFGLRSNQTSAQEPFTTDVREALSNGVIIAKGGYYGTNEPTQPYVSWTFRRAKRFFDIVIYDGDDSKERTIPHGLECEPGLIVVKSTSHSGYWAVYHRSADGDLRLDGANQGTIRKDISAANGFSLTLGDGNCNRGGRQYVAYLWAHDDSEDGIVQCGSYVGNGSTNGPEINLGWEPQWLLIKNASTTFLNGWRIYDAMRGMGVSNGPELHANTSAAETTGGQSPKVTATGFQINDAGSQNNQSGSTYIYLAIRRPNKPPKTGADVLNITHRTTAVTSVTTGFPVDTVLLKRSNANTPFLWFDRLRSVLRRLRSDATNDEAEQAGTLTKFDISTGFETGTNSDAYGTNTVSYAFRRAPGFFDVVCYTGTGSPTTVTHSLGVVPELIITKGRSQADGWYTYIYTLGADKFLSVQQTNAVGTSTAIWNNTAPTNTQFQQNVTAGVTKVAYLFASLSGISKVGSYIGNGSSQTIDCGFSTGARFVLIKRTDSTGDWLVADTARGIVAANDPRLSLNTTAAEVTTEDWLDPDPTGFIVNQVAGSNANVSGGQYIFLAIS